MTLDALKERFLQELAETRSRLEERQAYQQLKEKWDLFNPNQKKITVTLIALFIFTLVTLPVYNSYIESDDLITEFENKKELIRTLMLTQKDLSEMSTPTNLVNPEIIKSRIQNEVLQDGLLPEQTSAIENFTDYQGSKFFPEKIIQSGFQLKLNQITIKQLVQIATRIEGLSEQLKIRDLIVQSDSENKGYLNATVKVLILKLTEPSTEVTTNPEPPKRGRK